MKTLKPTFQQGMNGLALSAFLILVGCAVEDSPFDYTIIPLSGCSEQPVLVERIDTYGRYDVWSTNSVDEGWQEYAVRWADACVMTFEVDISARHAAPRLFTLDDLSVPQSQDINLSGVSIPRVIPDTAFSIPRIHRYLDACLTKETPSICSAKTADWLRENSALLRVVGRRGDTSFTMIEDEAAVTAVLR